ncbi:MAG: PAS domain S-box protein, partial [Calditrichaeota bacterium]
IAKRERERQLREREKWFRSIFETSAIGILLISPEGKLIANNTSFSKLLKYSSFELAKKSLFDILHQEDRSLNINSIIKQLREDDSFYQLELRFLRKNQEIVWARCTFSLVKDEQDRPQFVVGMIEDVTSQKRAVEALHASEERYRMLFNSAMDMVVVFQLGPDQKPLNFLEVNDAACQSLGYTRNELLSLTIGDICKAYHSEEFQEIFNKLLRQGHILYQTEFVTKYGQFIPLEVNAHFFTWKGKPTIISIARDISERIAVQEALKESEERYRGLFEGIPVGIYRTTAEGLIIDANPAFVSLLGYDSREELTTINVSDLYLNPEDRLRWKTVIDEVGVVRSFETQLVRKDGAIIWVRENSHSVKDETGKVLYYQGSVEDITIRKKMEERLQASENRYRDIVENSEDFIFTHDSSGIILSVNRAFVKGLGLKSDSQMVGKSLEEFLSESSRKTFQEYLQRILEKGSDFGYFELKTATGKLRVVEYQNSVRSSGGKTPVIRSISRDVTEKITTQKALEEEKERLMVTLRNIADGVITTDDQGKIVLMNHAAHRLLGLEEEEATGKQIEEIFRIEDEQSGERVPCPVMEVLKTGETIVHDQAVRLVTADDFDRLITYSVAPLHDNQHRLIGVVLAFQDVSKLLTLEEELHKAQKLESLGILAGGIAHDFNNILTAILGNISLAKMAAEKDGNLPKRLAEAENAILRAQDLTKQLLTFARGGAPVKRAASIVDIVKEITEFALRGSKCQPEFHFTDSIWPVEVDRGQISQVINNLVINAAQAMPKGGVIRVECGNVEIDEANKENSRLMKPGKYVKISITDEGEGIPREHLPIIFDPYFTTREHGTGLGLATSHSIVKKHGGYIFVDSEIGVGSTFTIFLPANPDTKLECTQSQTSIEQGRGKILVMDDEEAILDIASQMLLRLGYEVVTAKDGEQVIELYRKELEKGAPFDAVIMDLTIRGGMGGKEAVKKLKNLDPNLKAIVSSGYFNDPVIANYKEFGFVECIPKPYNMESLSTILRKVLEKTPVK